MASSTSTPSSRVILATASVLFISHVVVVVLIGPSRRGALLSNLIQLAIGILTILVTYRTAFRCGKIGRYFWRLASLSYGVWSIAQSLGTYAESFRPGFAERVDNLLFFSWFIPVGLTLVLNEDSDIVGFDWLRVIDASQAILFWIVAYLYFRLPLRPTDVAPAPGSLYFACYGVIIAAFFLRSAVSNSKIVGALLRRGGTLLLLSAGIDVLYQYGPGKNLPSGAWFDLLWSSLVFISLIAAATWKEPEDNRNLSLPTRAHRQVLVEMFSLLYPLMTLCLAVPIGSGHMAFATGIVALSLAGAGARLLVTQERLIDAKEELRRDLWNRKKAEEAMRESEERFRGAFEFAAIGMAIVGPDGRWLRVNRSLCDIVGFSEQELLARDFQSITHPDDLASDVSAVRRMLDGSLPCYQIEKRYIHKQGKIVWTLLSVSLVRDARGRPLYFISQIQDITKRKQAEEAHRQSEERFTKAFGSNPEGIAISTQADGRILEVNDAYVRMMGYERSELIGKTVKELDIWVCDERDSVIAKLIEEGSVRDYEGQFRTKSGKTIQALVSMEQIQVQQEEPCILVSIRDVTESRLLEQRLRSAQKMEAIGRLAGGVAHDFNNVLMIISGSAQIMQSGRNDRQENERYLAQIQAATEKAASLTRQLLAFSRQQVLHPTVLSLNNVVSDFWKLIPRLLGEDIETVLRLAPDLGNVNADRGQIEQVIMNLALNARDAMPNGGKLLLETANVYLDSGTASRHGAEIPGGSYVMLAVTDTGTGMDAETQAKVFEPFFTTKGLGKGTGLGLATVYGIVKQSAGYVWVYSELGKGTSFKVYLPRVQKKTETALPEPVSAPTNGGVETILLVEDEVALRELAADFLVSKGYNVLQAGNRRDALRACHDYDGPIHVMLTDVVLPGGGGPDLAKVVLEARPDVRTIYMSGYPDRVLSSDLTGDNGSFLQKPFSLEVLARTIRASLDSLSVTQSSV